MMQVGYTHQHHNLCHDTRLMHSSNHSHKSEHHIWVVKSTTTQEYGIKCLLKLKNRTKYNYTAKQCSSVFFSLTYEASCLVLPCWHKMSKEQPIHGEATSIYNTEIIRLCLPSQPGDSSVTQTGKRFLVRLRTELCSYYPAICLK
jgi:hypothetical protein